MTVLKFTASLSSASTRYQIATLGYISVRQIAETMAQQENRIAAGTLELARPVHTEQSLQDMDFHAGDRLVVFTQPAQRGVFFSPLRPGDKILRFFWGDTEISSRGKKVVLIGKPDENQRLIPDIDLRAVVPEAMHDFVSRQSVRLTFDDSSQIWVALKVGQTRVLLDESELGSEPVALKADHWMRFYRANENPNRNRPIGEIRLTVETIRESVIVPALPAGGVTVHVQIGVESTVQTLRASNTLPLGKVGTSLMQYVHAAPISAMQLTLMRVLPPQTLVSALKPDETLYAALSLRP